MVKTIPQQQDSILNKTGTYSPNYVKLSDVKENNDLETFLTLKIQYLMILH